MEIIPTIHLSGLCKDAFEVYKKAFNIEVKYLMTYQDAVNNGWEQNVPSEMLNRIYHSDVMFGEQLFHMADEAGHENANESSVFICFRFDEVEEVQNAFDVLKEDCKRIVYPPHSTEYSRITCSLVDKFGVRWGLMTEG